MTQDNVLKRYSARELKRFSDFDPDSIMLYTYPDEITKRSRNEAELRHYPAWTRSTSRCCTTSRPEGRREDRQREKSEMTRGRRLSPKPCPPMALLSMDTSRHRHGQQVHLRDHNLRQLQPLDRGLHPGAIQAGEGGRHGHRIEADHARLSQPQGTIDLATGKYTLEVSHKHTGGTGEYGFT